jgi:hypothetical protein
MPGMPRDLPPNQASTPHENGHLPRPRWPLLGRRLHYGNPDAGVSE